MDNLGWEVTQGIFLRVGYLCGRHDAHQVRKRHSLPSDEEALRLGLRLHYVEGMAKARLDRFEIDRPGAKLHITGEWVDSSKPNIICSNMESATGRSAGHWKGTAADMPASF